MKVLITGATGLVGKELVALFRADGVEVNYLTTSESKVQDNSGYKGFYWNPVESIMDKEALNGVSCIIHLAGASISKRWTKEYKQEILDSRVQSLNLLYNVLKDHSHSVNHMISASAIGIYPDSYEKLYSEEDTGVDNSFLGTVVEQWENAAQQIQKLGIKVSLIRTGLVLSDKGGALPQMAGPVKMGAGSAFGSGRQTQSWIHIDDVVNIYRYLYENRLGGVYNAVAPNPVTNDALMQAIAKALGKPYFMPKVPKSVLSAVLGEMHMLLFASQNVSASKILGTGYNFKFAQLQDALKDLL